MLARLLLAIQISLLCAVVFNPGANAEVIRSFETTIELTKDCILKVTEDIKIDFESAKRHGIYRIIPIGYTRHGGHYTLDLKIDSITADSESPLPFITSRQGDDLSIKIGDPRQTITGEHKYRIRYNVRRAVNFFSNEPEVYWNATGNEWPFRIETAIATFIPPGGVRAETIQVDSFQGAAGSTKHGSIERSGNRIVFSASGFNSAEGLTIVARLPAGSVLPPSAAAEIAWIIHDWWPALAFPICTLAVMFSLWYRHGRDIGSGQAVAVEWNPPKDLSPAQVGTLVDEQCDIHDIVSTLIDLAARGYLKITELRRDRFLFLSDHDYEFQKSTPPHETKKLTSHERLFLSALFDDGRQTVKLSQLKNRFYVHLPGIREALYSSMAKQGYFTGNPETMRSKYVSAGLVMLILGFLTGMILLARTSTLSYLVGFLSSSIIVFGFSGLMPARTRKGTEVLRACLGFQRFIKLTEKERIALLAKDDPTIFGRILPYAMVLGVADQWADKFKDLLKDPPDWFVPYRRGAKHSFRSHTFVNELSHGMHTMAMSFSSRPSSAGRGGSGMRGGFAGGGFGGGGGGSW